MADAGELQAYVVEHLGEAIERGWIEVHYQPVVRTVTGRLCGMEALARWRDPQLGVLGPGTIVGPLEDARRIHELDACVIRQVCRQLRADIEADRPVVPVSFNLSRLDFGLCDIQAVIEQAARDNEVPRSLLNVEITESVFGADPERMAAIVGRFHEAGYQVWMDDFGSAYSSLNMLKDFEFDEIKIDMGFLSRFGERSRAIIASVVDMAKRLGIETLAEGVETHEHAEFLRHIGCEKQQGFLYGRPEPHSPERLEQLEWELGVERTHERAYYRTIGGVNTLSLSERDFMPENTTKDYVTSMPLAFVEYDGEFFSVLDCNDPFAEALEDLGLSDAEAVEALMNDTSRAPARSSRRLVGVIREREFARHDYVLPNGSTCVMRARHVATEGGRTTMLVTIDSTARTRERERRSRMERAFSALHAIYEHVDIIHLDEGYSEPVYSQAAFKSVYDVPELADAVRQFAENEIYPDDHARYLAFMDIDTMSARITASGQGFLADFFRARDHGGDFAWKLFLLIGVAEGAGRDVLVCIRDTNRENDRLFQAAFEPGGELHGRHASGGSGGFGKHAKAGDSGAGAGSGAGSGGAGSGDAGAAAEGEVEAAIGAASLWRTIERNQRFGIFWKDTERRFVGCNGKFLEYFGLDSVDDVRGKTDEDMGWHVDPVPFREEEQRVLGEGATSEGVAGQCVVGGRIRDIVTSKQPIYRNGRVVGLLGYFIDAAEGRASDELVGNAAQIDPVTGTFNHSGIDAAIDRFIEAYQRTGTSFAVMMVGIENYKHISSRYGYDFGDKVLAVIADVIRTTTGTSSVVGRIRANCFAVLKQNVTVGDCEALCDATVLALASITEVDDTPCTVYAHAAFARGTEADDAEALKRLVRSRLRAR